MNNDEYVRPEGYEVLMFEAQFGEGIPFDRELYDMIIDGEV